MKNRILIFDPDQGRYSETYDLLSNKGYFLSGFLDESMAQSSALLNRTFFSHAVKTIDKYSTDLAAIICENDLNTSISGVTGSRFISRLRKYNSLNPIFKSVPIIVYTLNTSFDVEKSLSEAGANNVISRLYPDRLIKSLNAELDGDAFIMDDIFDY